MPKITLHTEIKAEIKVVFDLSRSIDLHKISTKQTNEQAIAGTTSGLIEINESVTWRAKHFGVYQNLTSNTEYTLNIDQFLRSLIALFNCCVGINQCKLIK